MLKKIKKKSKFGYDVLTLMTGTAIAQIVSILVSPILTRVYTPDEFGLFSLYMAIISVVVVISTGRYELAIMLPKRNIDAFQIAVLAAFIMLLACIVSFLIIFLFDEEMAILVHNEKIGPYLYIVPLSVFLTGSYLIIYNWFNRNKNYKAIAISKVIQSVGTVGSQLTLSGLWGGAGLILGQVLGQFISLIYFFKIMCRNKRKVKLRKSKIKQLGKLYSRFPKIDVITSLVNVSASQAPNFLLVSIFSPSAAGFYYLTQRVLQGPVNLISSSILDVFKQRASEDYSKYGNCSETFKKTFLTLLLMALPTSIFLYFWVEELFVLIFGESWREAGLYAQLLIPALFFRFLASPLSFVLYISEKQFLNLLGMIILLVLVLLSLFHSNNPKEAVFYISLSYSVVYLLYLIASIWLSGWLR